MYKHIYIITIRKSNLQFPHNIIIHIQKFFSIKRILKRNSNFEVNRGRRTPRIDMSLYTTTLISHATYDTCSQTFVSIFI